MRALWLLLLVGCAEEAVVNDSGEADTSGDTEAVTESDTDAGTESDTEADVDTDAPSPVVGNGMYDTSNFTVDSDPCMLENFQDVSEFLPAVLQISQSTSTSFQMGEPGGDSQQCTLSADNYTCTRFESVEETPVGADLIIDTGLSGTVLSAGALDGVLDLSITCDGGGCTLLELGGLTFPCAFGASFDLDAQ